MNKIYIIFVMFALAGCAHESQVAPSTGHIDGQVNGQQTGKVAADGASAIPKPVKNTAFLPPPKPKVKEQTYSVVVNEVPVKEILFALARDSKLNIDIHPAIQGRVTLNAVDQTLPAILERLSKQVDLTYKIEGNVLSITPDLPVLRSYKVDYVNISRDTTGSVGVAAEIAGTGGGVTTGSSGSSSSSSTGTTNSSKTLVASISKNHFWETLIGNIKDILAETDKEVIISRNTNTSQPAEQKPSGSGEGSANKTAGATNNKTETSSDQQSKQEKDEARAEYKTLFAATVIANQETGVISVRATNKQHERVQEFLDKIMSSATRQVLIEATIVEVQLNDAFQAGIDWSRLGQIGGSGFIFSQVLGPQIATSLSGASIVRSSASPGIVAGYINGSHGFLSSLQLLKQFGDTKVLSSPKLMVLNNQTAVLKVVDNLVYFTVESQISQATAAGGANLQSVTTTAHTVPVGVVMSVTPQINDGGIVNINVRPTISSLIRYVPDPNPQIVAINNQGIPEIQVREMESMLQINSGNTAVLGGLMQDEIKRNTDKVPGLADLPLIGKAFTGRNDLNKKTELVIFLRPTVIRNASLESDELQSFKQFLPGEQLQQTVDEPTN